MIATQSLLSLRRILIADALIGVPTGLLMALAAQPLASLLNIPSSFLLYIGWLLVAIALGVCFVATRPQINRSAVWAVVIINTIWALESFAIVLLGWIQPNALGIGFVFFQGAVVAALAILQYLGLQRERV
jgi:hypothetical protein